MKRPIVITLLTIALLLVLAGIGAVVYFSFNHGQVGFMNPNRVSEKSEETKTLKVESPVSLTIQDDAGDVSVVGADVEQVTVKVVKTGFGFTQSDAKNSLEDISYTIEQNGGAVSITFKHSKFNTRVAQTVDFYITVPLDTKVQVNADLGKISVSGVNGDVKIAGKFGDVDAQKISGALDVETESGRVDVVSVKSGGADIYITTGFGNIRFEQVSSTNINAASKSGSVKFENVRASKEMQINSEFGNITFDLGAAGELIVKTNSGKIEMTSVNVSGALELLNDFGDIDLEKVTAKSYDVETNSGSITLDGAQGSLKAHTGFGNITVKNAKEAILDLDTQSGAVDFAGSLGKGAHTVHSEFGEIELALPADSALDVDLSTEFGKITSEIPVTVTLSGDLEKGKQAGTMNGGGSQLNVATKNGNITIKILGE